MKYLLMSSLIFFLLVASACSFKAQTGLFQPRAIQVSPIQPGVTYKILNFDKILNGTDKLIYMVPPSGKYWIVLQGSTELEKPVPGATFHLWMENAPYAPYRDPITGEMQGCERCLTLVKMSAADNSFFPFKGTISDTLVVSYPNRLMAVITPVHGGFDVPVPTWTRIAVLEYDLP